MSTINLGSGDNTWSIPTIPGEYQVNAEGGNDRLIVDYSSLTGPIVWSGGWSTGSWQTLTDEAFNTITYVNFEAFTITGGSESDEIRGGNGEGALADSLSGGAGNDTIYSGLGNDVIDGGAGSADRWVVDYSSLGMDIAVVLKATGPYTVAASGAQVKNIEALTLVTGVGADLVNTSAVVGDDSIDTGEGDDTVNSGLGFDYVRMYGGNDTLIVNYASKTEDIMHVDNGGGWYTYQDGPDPTASVYFYTYEIENFNLTGGAGNDALYGAWYTDGNDRLIGNYGNDTLYGYGGVDTIAGGEASATVAGAESDGTDTWVVNYDEVNADVVIDISTFVATVSTGASVRSIEQLIVDTYLGDDTITCNPGIYNDIVYTRDGNDVITTGRGVDVVEAGNGSDTLIIDWSAVTTPINDVYDAGWYRYTSGSGDSVRYYNVEMFNVKGGSAGDYLAGGGSTDTLSGGGGNDTLNSGAGLATIDGGGGTDIWQADVSGILDPLVINAKAGQTTAQGTGAGHSISRIEGFNISTGAGNDNLNSSAYAVNDYVETNDGNDTVALGLGHDTVNGGNGVDKLVLNYSSLTTAVNRWYDGGWYVYGDKLDTAAVRYYSFERFDLTGGKGSDHLVGGGWNTTSTDAGLSSYDRLIGGGGNDVLEGGGGKDTIDGGNGNDRWVGDYAGATSSLKLALTSAGDATLKVNSVAHTTLKSIENVTLNTGAGNDVINLMSRAGNHIINLGNGNDTVKLGSGKHVVNGEGNSGVGDTLVVDFHTSTTAIRNVYDGGWYKMYDTGGLNSVRYYGFEQFEFIGGSGNDRLYGFGGDDKLTGNAGNDVLNGQGGNDILTGGGGGDLFYFESYNNGVDTITDASTGDTIRVNGRDFTGGAVVMGDGTSVVTNQVQMSVDSANNETTLYIGSDGSAGADVVIKLQGIYTTDAFTLAGRDISLTKGATNPGTPGDDVVNGTTGNDELSGGDGNDKLLGKAGNDVLDGGTGNDKLIGGGGADTMTGGTGADMFVYTSIWDSTPGTLNHDVITDFVSGEDKIDLSVIDANPVAAGDQAFTFVTAYTGSAGEVMYDSATGLISADINADGLTDIEIMLEGAPTLLVSDFVL